MSSSIKTIPPPAAKPYPYSLLKKPNMQKLQPLIPPPNAEVPVRRLADHGASGADGRPLLLRQGGGDGAAARALLQRRQVEGRQEGQEWVELSREE